MTPPKGPVLIDLEDEAHDTPNPAEAPPLSDVPVEGRAMVRAVTVAARRPSWLM